MTKNDGERIAALETKVETLTTSLDKMSEKLDDLLALRHKGVGAFWLASALLGTSIMGAILTVIEWVKSWH